MSKTKHLDGAIAALSNKASAKRAPRKAQVELVLYVDHKNGTFSITANNRPLVTDALIKDSDPVVAVKARAAAIKGTGKTVNITIY